MEAPYGSWASPIDARRIAEGGVGLGWPQAVGEAAYWVEMRPTEDGRYVIVRRDPGGSRRRRDAVRRQRPDPGARVRRRHVRRLPQRVAAARAWSSATTPTSACTGRTSSPERRSASGAAGPAGGSEARRAGARRARITPAPPAPRAWRYADARRDARRPAARLRPRASRRRRRGQRPRRAPDRRRLRARRSSPTGHDFFAGPRLSADGTRLAWLSWDHPRMPWDGTELWVARDRRRRPRRRRRTSWPAGRRSRSSSPTGRRTATFCS